MIINIKYGIIYLYNNNFKNMQKLFAFEKKHAAVKLLLLRLVIGAIFIAHGTAKWGMWQASPSEQLPAAMMWTLRALSIVEPIAGVAMILGLFVPIFSIVLALIMVGATYFSITKFGKPFTGGWAYELLILVSSLVLASHGGGKFSLDEMMANKKSASVSNQNQAATPTT
ncbi:MAG: hypothetical protein CMI53_02375 [Parcubacteria group bacterium]|nr:hypothetical protein [Parcubacteria group bacterium]|tara:strand:- start:731 stop:1240 length:510 start_codon:yes stop_codon:yes gene_type:complete